METKDRRKGPRPVPASRSRQKSGARKERKLRDADVVYTPPKPFQRGRFVLRLVTVVAVVLAMVLGMSIFFKVETVSVSGCNKYTAWEVAEASGIETGSNLLTVSRAKVSGSILSRLPYVDTVRVGIFLPNTVNIEITELDVVYAAEDTQGNWWLINADGKAVEQTNGVTAKNYTQILGLRLDAPVIGAAVTVQEEVVAQIPLETGEGEATEETTEPPETTEAQDEEEDVLEITGADRLKVVLEVLRELSRNSIIGKIDSVNVTDIQAIELWYDQRFQINLGDTQRLEYKVGALKATVEKMESYESGHLDISFTNWPDKVGYTPFS